MRLAANTVKVSVSGACTRLTIPAHVVAEIGLDPTAHGQEIALEETEAGFRYQKYQNPTEYTPDRFVKKVHKLKNKDYLFFYHSHFIKGDTYKIEIVKGWAYLTLI